MSDLRNSSNERSKSCYSNREPVLLTKNEVDDMIVSYECQQAQLELYAKLTEAEEEIVSGAEGADFFEFANKLRAEIQGASDLY